MATRQDEAKEIVRQMKAQQHEATAARVFEVGDTIKDLSYCGEWWRVMAIKIGIDDEGHSYQILRCGLLSEGYDVATFASFDGGNLDGQTAKAATVVKVCHWDDYEGCAYPLPFPKDD